MANDNMNSSQSFEVYLVQKPNTSSVIWNYFGVKVNSSNVPIPDELEKPVCKLCNKSITAKQSNTTNLHTHHKDNHPDAYAIVQREKTSLKVLSLSQPTLSEVLQKNA